MTAKDMELVVDPWKMWPDGVIPAEGKRSAWKLRTPEEGRAWLQELAESRKMCKLPEGISAVDVIRQERDEH